MSVTPISTKEYLLRKKSLVESIGWYEENIPKLKAQLDAKYERLEALQDELFKLERLYEVRTNVY